MGTDLRGTSELLCPLSFPVPGEGTPEQCDKNKREEEVLDGSLVSIFLVLGSILLMAIIHFDAIGLFYFSFTSSSPSRIVTLSEQILMCYCSPKSVFYSCF